MKAKEITTSRRLPLLLGYMPVPGTADNSIALGVGDAADVAIPAIKQAKGYFVTCAFDAMDDLPKGKLPGVLCQMIEDRTVDSQGHEALTFRPLGRVRVNPGVRLRDGSRSCSWVAAADVGVDSINTSVESLRAVLRQLSELSSDWRAGDWGQLAELRSGEVLLNRAADLAEFKVSDYNAYISTNDVAARVKLVLDHYQKLLRELPSGEIQRFLEEDKLPEAVDVAIRQQLAHLASLDEGTAEHGTVLEALRAMIRVPWVSPPPPLPMPPNEAKLALDSDHSGAEQLKQAILDQVYSLNWHQGKPKADTSSAPLLLVGPPGIGKTSILNSMAKALNRPLQIIGCSTITDAQSLTGSQRVWVGAQLGEVMQSVIRAKSGSLILAFDEVDKFSSDGQRQDGLWAVLMSLTDKVRNGHFTDQYLGQEFDLSKATIVATANDVSRMPLALLDRFRVVELRGYSALEKFQIAKDYLLPKLRSEQAIDESQLLIPDQAIKLIIDAYDSESGVRELNRNCEKIFAKSLRELMAGGSSVVVDEAKLREYLGPPRKDLRLAISRHVLPGTGDVLAVGRDGTGYVEHVQICLLPVTDGKTVTTGTMGKEYRETILRARDYIVANAAELGVESREASRLLTDHMHVAHDGIGNPVDGPSGGVSLTLAMLSFLYKQPWPDDLVATGALELHGKVSPIGQLPEKLTAALRCGKKRVIIPADNLDDLSEVAADTLGNLEVLPIKNIDEAVRIAFPNGPGVPTTPPPVDVSFKPIVLRGGLDDSAYDPATLGISA